MKSGVFQEMLQRYLQGAASPDEVKFIEQYDACYEDVDDPEISEPKFEAIKNKIKEEIDLKISQSDDEVKGKR